MASMTYKRGTPAVKKVEPPQTGIWVVICAMSMTFAALASSLALSAASVYWHFTDIL